MDLDKKAEEILIEFENKHEHRMADHLYGHTETMVLEAIKLALTIPVVNRSLPTSTEPFSLITKQIIENADRVIEAVKKANTITISQDTVDRIELKPKR